MAKSTMFTFLMHGTESSSTITYAKLCDIIDYGDIEGTPNEVDSTTLSDSSQRSVPGVKQGSSIPCTAPYDKTTYEALKDLEGTIQHLAIWDGGTESAGVVTPTGSAGKWSFDGYVTVSKNGGGVDDLDQMTITINVDSAVDFE